jgi:hypothetical protein
MMLAQVIYLISLLSMGALARYVRVHRASRMVGFFRWLEAWFGVTVIGIAAWLVDAHTDIGVVYDAIVILASLGVASSAVVCWLVVLRRVAGSIPAVPELDDLARWLAARDDGRARILRASGGDGGQ